MKFKYIMTVYSPIIFNELLLHTQVALGVKDILSAGFVRISFGVDGFNCETYGESISLEMKPRSEDAQRIKDFLNNKSK